MDEDILGIIISLCLLLSIIIIIIVGVEIHHDKNIELEKYKIEMNIYKGDITND